MNKFFLILILIFVSCNKNSLELPPPKDNISVREITCSLDNTQKALITFKQDKYDKEGKVEIEVSNLSGSDLNELKIYIEMCDSASSYYSCNNQFVSLISHLDTGNNFIQQLPFTDINLDSVKINAGILSTTNQKMTLSGLYSGNFVRCESTIGPNIVSGLIGFVKGYVFADGISTFRISFGNGLAYNITGNFADTLAFNNGKFLDRNPTNGFFDHIASTVVLETPDTVGYFNGNPLLFNFLLTTPQTIPGSNNPTTDKLFFNLIKIQ